MKSNLDRFEKELKTLIRQGDLLRYSMYVETGRLTKERLEEMAGKELELPDFRSHYEEWYSLSRQVVKQLLPDRVADFVRLYRDEKRKQISFSTYGVSDYTISLLVQGLVTVDGRAAVPKFEQQVSIVKSASARLKGSLFEMQEILQADLLMTSWRRRESF